MADVGDLVRDARTERDRQDHGPLAGLDPTFATAIDALIAASGGRVTVQSAYRSNEEQQQLWDQAVAKYGSPEAARKWVAPPGHSNHNRGLAVDLGGDTALAHELAPRFGLVFPMSWEPWHIEPVHARDSSTPMSYSEPPPGETTPTEDQSLGTQPEFLAASLSNALRSVMDPTAAGWVAPAAAGTPAATNADGTPAAGASTTSTSLAANAGGAGRVAPEALYQALRGQGLPPAAAAALVSIAGRESSYSPTAYNGDRSTGDDSYGLFQINLLNGGWAPYLEAHGMRDPAQSLRTVAGSVEAAALIYKNSGLNPWGGYKGEAWHNGTDMNAGVNASGGEVTLADLEGLQ